jgi:hypothetical protein
MGSLEGSSRNSGNAERARARAQGKWTDCPAFFIGGKYILSVSDASDARLDGLDGSSTVKLEYLKSASLAVDSTHAVERPLIAATQATVHMTSSPSGADIFIDGKYSGNTPSDLTLAAGEHLVRVSIGVNEWSRVLQITTGEIRVHAEIIEKQ